MPSFIQYSPWQDAAEYGRGLGQTLAAILFKIPQLRSQEAYRTGLLSLREQQLRLNEELGRGRLQESEERLSLQRQLGEQRGVFNDMRLGLEQIKTGIAQERADTLKALAEARIPFLNAQAAALPDFASGRLENLDARTRLALGQLAAILPRLQIQAGSAGAKRELLGLPPPRIDYDGLAPAPAAPVATIGEKAERRFEELRRLHPGRSENAIKNQVKREFMGAQ